MTSIDFIFDFGSPNAYLAHKLIPGLERRTGAAVTYVPCLLGGIFKATGNQSPMVKFAHVKNRLPYEMLEIERFVARHGMAFAMNPHFPINTLTLMRGAVAADEIGEGRAYRDVVFDAMWAAGENMGEADVVSRVLAGAGLNAEKILGMTADPGVKSKLIANTEAAAARGAFGAPTFFIGDEMWFGKDRLEAVEAYLSADA